MLEIATSFSEPSSSNQVAGSLPGKKIELPLLNFNTIAAATDYFANANKLGEGGFGPVYKVITLNLYLR